MTAALLWIAATAVAGAIVHGSWCALTHRRHHDGDRCAYCGRPLLWKSLPIEPTSPVEWED